MLVACMAAFGCALCYGAGSVLQSVGARRVATIDGLNPTLVVRFAGQVPYVAGLLLDLVGWLLSLVAVRLLPLFAVQAILAGSVGVTALLAAIFLGSRPSGTQIVGLAALGVGVTLLAATAEPGPPHRVSTAVSWAAVVGVPVLAGGPPALRFERVPAGVRGRSSASCQASLSAARRCVPGWWRRTRRGSGYSPIRRHGRCLATVRWV
jgi:hypothetical protein